MEEGGASIQSSRWGFARGGREVVVVEVTCDDEGVWWVGFRGFVDGREGPKSSSEESDGERGVSWAGQVVVGGEEGRSSRGAGGREGPITRRVLEVLSSDGGLLDRW